MQGFKLVQKMQCIEESECRRRWKRYTLKNQTLGGGMHQNMFPLMRAWDRQLQKNVVIEFMPRGCLLNMYPEPAETADLLRLMQLQHPQLLGVQDLFYCDRMKCVCVVYDLRQNAEPLTKHIKKMNLTEIQRVFKQIANALAFLYHEGIVIGWFNLEDVFVTPDPATASLNAEIRYIKLGCRKDMYHMYIHPEYYFPKLINKSKYSTQDCQALQLSWQMGILLLEMLRGQQFPPNCTEQEYVHNVDQICNYWDSPDISISMHLPKEVTEILTGLTAVGLEERWHLEMLFDFLWVNVDILNQPGLNKPGLERDDDFLSTIQNELVECSCDEDEEEESEDGGSKEAEMKEAVEEYVQYYEEAKALQEKNQGKRKQRARRMSLSECYYQVMANKNLGGQLHSYLTQDSGLMSDSIVSEDFTDNSASLTEFGDVQHVQNVQLSQVSVERPLLRTKSMPPVHFQDVIQSLASQWGRCLRGKSHSLKM